MISRVLSLLVAGIYCLLVVVPAKSLGSELIGFVGWLLFSLGCIWLGEGLGESRGMWGLSPSITASTPGLLVKGMGWLLLLFPVWFPFLSRFLMGSAVE